MDCDRSRDLISEFLDKELPPQLSLEVKEHCLACASCRKEFQELRSAVQALRETPREQPPQDLEARILDSVRAFPATAGGSLIGGARSRRRGIAPLVLAAAAALLLVGLTGLAVARSLRLQKELAGREGDLRGVSERLAKLERDLPLELDRSEEKRVQLSRDLDAVRLALDEARRSADKAILEKDEERAALRSRIVDLEARLRSHSGEIERLEVALASSEEETSELKSQLEVAMADAATRETRPDEPGSQPPPPEVLPAEVVAAPREARVVFRRRGAILEMEARGPREALVPELLRIAWSGGDEAVLALARLEDMLGGATAGGGTSGAESRENINAEPGEVRGFLRREANRVATNLGLVEPAEVSAASPGSKAAERLLRLERLWQEERSGVTGAAPRGK